MRDVDDRALLEGARAAAGRGEWANAYQQLVDIDVRSGLSGEDVALLAKAAYAAGHLDVTIDAWERAHAGAIRAGDPLAAAGAATQLAMHLLFDTALLAPIRGWAARAERLLEGRGDTPVHAWLGVVRSYERLLSGDFDRAREWARRAIEVGSACEPTAAAVGRVADARAMILQGDVSRGLERLNEAAVAAVSGEIDPLSTGIVYCEVVCALQAIAQFDLAEQWTAAMEQWRQGQPVGSIHGRCRVHRAEILRLRGNCGEAEQEAQLACEELRPYLRRELGWPLTELGRIRLRKGDLTGAESALVAAHEAGWDPQPGLALVRLAQGDGSLAVGLIRDAVEHPINVPSKELPPNTELRLAPLLEAQVEIEIAAGDIERAESAAAELARIARAFGSAPLAAGSVVADGRVRLARGDTSGAARLFEAGAHQWMEIGAPYEAATARLLLAEALKGGGHEARAALELSAARATYSRIGAEPPMTAHALPVGGTARQGVPEHGTKPVPPQHRFSREGEYWSVAFEHRALRIRDAKGMRYLARLLSHPGREFHALDLVIEQRAQPLESASELRAALSNDAGEVLDRRAKEAYRRRLTEIADDLDDARRCGDTVRAEQVIAERSFLARELARAVGLGGRDRRVGSAAERARVSVTRAVRHAMLRLRAHDPQLADHLDRTIRTGTYCVYLPDPRVPVAWIV